MGTVHRHIFVMFVLVLTGFLAACQQQENSSQQVGNIEANKAYEEHFGSPPTPQRGYAFARVGYLPVRSDPQKVGAIPLYLYDQQSQLQQILHRLAGGEIVLPNESPLYQPFPEDIEVVVAPLEEGIQTVTVTTSHRSDELQRSGLMIALAETALQFPEIDAVRVILNGRQIEDLPGGVYRHEPQRIVPAGPPSIIMIAGMWEEGAEFSEEILVNFDRPVKVQKIGLYDPSGQRVEGDYFTSVFDMAVVVHPESPKNYPAGIKLRAVWEITDALGRSNSGDNTLPLKRYDH